MSANCMWMISFSNECFELLLIREESSALIIFSNSLITSVFESKVLIFIAAKIDTDFYSSPFLVRLDDSEPINFLELIELIL